MYGLVVPKAGLTSLILAAFMTLHLEILDDLQLDDMIHSASQVLNQNAPVLEDFADHHSYPAIRAVGFNIRQKRHGMKEMTGVMKAAFVSPYTGLPYDGLPLNLLYFPDDPSLKKSRWNSPVSCAGRVSWCWLWKPGTKRKSVPTVSWT